MWQASSGLPSLERSLPKSGGAISLGILRCGWLMVIAPPRADLSVFEIALPGGGTVPLSSIAEVIEARGWGERSRAAMACAR